MDIYDCRCIPFARFTRKFVYIYTRTSIPSQLVSRHTTQNTICVQLATSTLLLLQLSVVVPASRAQKETADELEFSYIPGSVNGPENWGNIKEEWATCSTGRMQSPIDLSDSHASQVPQLNCSYHPAEASIVNRGHDIAVVFQGGAGSLSINGTVYYLRQLHWHNPSEHRVNGRRYSLELHMVHQSAANKPAVIGVLYKIGRRDHFLHKLEPYLQRMADTKEKEESVGVVDPLDASLRFHSYRNRRGHLPRQFRLASINTT